MYNNEEIDEIIQKSENIYADSGTQGTGSRRKTGSWRFSGNKRKPVNKRRRVILIVLVCILLLLLILYIDSNVRLVTEEYKLYYENLPEVFDGFRIVVLSDIHGAEYGQDNDRLVKAVIAAKPDIIAITGDLIDRFQSGRPVERQLETAETLVKMLVRVAPVYFVTGNHEWDSGMVRPLLDMLNECGVHVLRNQYALQKRGGESFVLAGVDDPNGPADMLKPDELVDRIRTAEGDKFLILLSHRNYYLKEYSVLGIDLVLSGHSHGGMVRLPLTDGLIGPQYEFMPTYTNGLYSLNGTDMVVSRGLGNHFGWTRFLNNPHIVVVELKVNKPDMID